MPRAPLLEGLAGEVGAGFHFGDGATRAGVFVFDVGPHRFYAGYRHLEEDPDRTADVFIPYAFDPVTANRGGHGACIVRHG